MKKYSKLEKAMAEMGVTKVDIAKKLKLRYATVIDKFKGKSRFTYDEARDIKNEFFSEFNLEDLFEEDSTREEEKDE